MSYFEHFIYIFLEWINTIFEIKNSLNEHKNEMMAMTEERDKEFLSSRVRNLLSNVKNRENRKKINR